jgi:hypothetical protein
MACRSASAADRRALSLSEKLVAVGERLLDGTMAPRGSTQVADHRHPVRESRSV